MGLTGVPNAIKPVKDTKNSFPTNGLKGISETNQSQM